MACGLLFYSMIGMTKELAEDWFEREQLHFAAQDGDVGKIQALLTAGYDINAFDELGKTPLHYAAEKEFVEVVRFLLEHGADVNAHCEPRIGNTPLAEITDTCSLQMAKLLIKAGADPRIPGWMQISALDRAKNRKHGEGPQVYALLASARSSCL